MTKFTHRLAQPADAPAIVELMQESIAENMKPFLSLAEIEAARETMGVDWTLIEDRTYFLVETAGSDERVLVGCGIGTLLLDLAEEAARNAGFKSIELGSTTPGEPFYLARGYKEVSRTTQIAANGAPNVVIKMAKAL